MNNMLDTSSPLEALAFNYATFGVFTVVNNLWAWVAVITAAISFWRIRTTSFSDKPDHQQPLIDRNTSGSQLAQPPANTSSAEAAPPCPIPALPPANDVDGVTEGSKYTFYYYEEGQTEGDGDGEATSVVKEWRDDADSDGVSSCVDWRELEGVRMRARIEDMGWYRCQDLTVVNGNVVRLWDERRRRSEKSCCYSSCSAVWSSVD